MIVLVWWMPPPGGTQSAAPAVAWVVGGRFLMTAHPNRSQSPESSRLLDHLVGRHAARIVSDVLRAAGAALRVRSIAKPDVERERGNSGGDRVDGAREQDLISSDDR